MLIISVVSCFAWQEEVLHMLIRLLSVVYTLSRFMHSNLGLIEALSVLAPRRRISSYELFFFNLSMIASFDEAAYSAPARHSPIRTGVSFIDL